MKPATIAITVHCFAGLAEALGGSHVSLELPAESTVATLKQELRARLSGTTTSWDLLVARDGTYAADHELLTSGQEWACFPPVSGG